jgi:hypothetical protein
MRAHHGQCLEGRDATNMTAAAASGGGLDLRHRVDETWRRLFRVPWVLLAYSTLFPAYLLQ